MDQCALPYQSCRHETDLSEQLSFLLRGPCTSLLANIVFSQLDSDLPFYLWWQGEFHDPIDPQLWAWVDRVIYDSHGWTNFPSQLALLQSAQEQARQRVVLCDLNWTRLDKIRLGLAQFFDPPASHHHFKTIEAGEIVFAPSYRSMALLLVRVARGTIGVEGRQAAERRNRLLLIGVEGQKITLDLREQPGQPIQKVSLVSKGVSFDVIHRRKCGLARSIPRKTGRGLVPGKLCRPAAMKWGGS